MQTFFTFRLSNANEYTIADFTNCATGNELVVHWGGYDLVNQDISDTLSADLFKIESGSIPVLIFLVVIAYGGIVAALLPLILAFWTVVMSFTALHITAISYNVSLYVSSMTLSYIECLCRLILFIIYLSVNMYVGFQCGGGIWHRHRD